MTTFGYTLMGEEHDPRDLVAADDQEGWFRFWADELAPRLGAPTHEPAAAGA